MATYRYEGRYGGIQDKDDLNETALRLTQSLHESLSATQTGVHYQHGYLQIQLLDQRTCLLRAQSWDRAITGLLEPLTEPPNETQIVIDDQSYRPT